MTAFRRVLALLPPASRRGWWALAVLAVVTAGVETVGTAAVFALVRQIGEPTRPVTLPWLGALAWPGPPGPDGRVTVALTAAVAALYFCKNGLLALGLWLQQRRAWADAAHLGARLVAGYLAAPYAFHVATGTAALLARSTTAVERLVRYVLIGGLALVVEVLVVAGIAAVLLTVAPLSSVLALATLGAILAGTLRLLGRAGHRAGAAEGDAQVDALRSLEQLLGAIREIKAHGREAHFVERHADREAALGRLRVRAGSLHGLPRIAVETLFIGGLLSVVMLLAAGAGTEGGALPLLGLFAYAGFRVIPSANRILMHASGLRHTLGFARDLLADLERGGAPVQGPAPAPLALADRVAFDEVWFAYAGRDAPVLQGLSLEIRRGESVAVVGATGAGKSTLVALVLGLLEPTRGRLTIDGAPLDERLPAWRRAVGYVPQDACLVEGTLRDNVVFGAPGGADPARLAEALRLAQLDETIAALPAGVDTPVGDRGVQLSGGQRQRVAIARALYHDPQLIVFDEATSALDPGTESALVAAIEALRGRRTLLIVAHRAALARACDRVVLLADGRVAASGPFDELAATSERFRALQAL